MGLTEILEKSEKLNKIEKINSLPDKSNPPEYLQLFFNNHLIALYNLEGMQIKISNPSFNVFKIMHYPVYRKMMVVFN